MSARTLCQIVGLVPCLQAGAMLSAAKAALAVATSSRTATAKAPDDLDNGLMNSPNSLLSPRRALERSAVAALPSTDRPDRQPVG